MIHAEELFNKTFFLAMGKWNMINSLRSVGKAGLPYAVRKVSSEYQGFMRQMTSDPRFTELLLPADMSGNELSVENLKTLLITDTVDTFQKAVDFASLVFAHSTLDGVAFDYCRVTALTAPEAWVRCVEKKEFTLKRIAGVSYEDLLKEALGHFLSTLERESLVKKLDCLFAICQPPHQFEPLSDYSYDRSVIDTLDRMRHQIIHGDIRTLVLPNVEEHLWYLQKTSWFLMALVAQKFGLKIDPMQAVAVFGVKSEKD
jgi:hypothetical protein